MHIYDYNYYDKKLANINLIKRHIKEIEEVSQDKSRNKELEFEKLRNKHSIESNTYHYYNNIFKNNIVKDNFHGFSPLMNIDLTYKNKSLFGTIFVLYPGEIFASLENDKKIEIKEIEKVDKFYNYLINTPLPFVFLSKCELYDFQDFMKNIYDDLKDGGPNIFITNNLKYDVILMEPYTVTHIDLSYLIDNIVKDDQVHSFLVGFISGKNS